MNKLWPIVKGAISFFAFTGIVTFGVVYYLSTQETSATLQNDVVPKLEYLVKADSANRSRDIALSSKLDSTRDIVALLATDKALELIADSMVSKGDYYRQMKPLDDYLSNQKKNSLPIVYDSFTPSYFNTGTLTKNTEAWEIPPEWIQPPDTRLKTIKEKSNLYQ